MTRHSIRKVAFQLLFALASNPETEIDALYEQLRQDDEHLPQEMPAYLLELTQGVAKQADELDAVITSYLNNQWSLARLNKTDLLLLRLAIYEIKYVSAIPAKVAVDEALQLAKEFSDEKSRRFINGILSNLIEKNEED